MSGARLGRSILDPRPGQRRLLDRAPRQPPDMVDRVVFLASDASAFMTGRGLVIAAGRVPEYRPGSGRANRRVDARE